MPFTELSMGMSGDYVQAIQHGATFVRVGSAFLLNRDEVGMELKIHLKI